AMNMAPFIFWNLAFYTIIRTQLMEDTSLSFIEKVQSIEEVKSFTQMGQKIMIQCADSFAVTQKVMSLAQEEEVQIDSLNVKNSNLEHVFLHLTGKTLRA
ncbi:hypothetical protein ABNF51_19865, partial [Paenibacillus larvae]